MRGGEHHSLIAGEMIALLRRTGRSDWTQLVWKIGLGICEVSWTSFLRFGNIKLSYKIDQVEKGWTVTTVDGTVFVFPDAKEMAEWFCMVVGVPFLYRKIEDEPLEEEIRKLARATASLMT